MGEDVEFEIDRETYNLLERLSKKQGKTIEDYMSELVLAGLRKFEETRKQ